MFQIQYKLRVCTVSKTISVPKPTGNY